MYHRHITNETRQKMSKKLIIINLLKENKSLKKQLKNLQKKYKKLDDKFDDLQIEYDNS